MSLLQWFGPADARLPPPAGRSPGFAGADYLWRTFLTTTSPNARDGHATNRRTEHILGDSLFLQSPPAPIVLAEECSNIAIPMNVRFLKDACPGKIEMVTVQT